MNSGKVSAYIGYLYGGMSVLDSEKIMNDPLISKTSYTSIVEGYTLYVCKNSKQLFTPVEQHQMYAKGLVLAQNNETQELFVVGFPYVKFYNLFEEVVQKELPYLKYDKKQIVRKYDGVLVSRWQFEGKTFFSTRGRIITPDNPYWNALHDAVKTFPEILDYNPKLDGRTDMFELVGPDAKIVEVYHEHSLVYTGSFNADGARLFTFEDTLPWNAPITETYDGDNPQDIISKWEGIREGVIEQYFDAQGYVIYRVKYKQEEYLKAHRVKSHASVKRLEDMVVEHKLITLEALHNHLVSLSTPEEIIKWYEDEYAQVLSRVLELTYQATEMLNKVHGLNLPSNQKERYFALKEEFSKHDLSLVVAYLAGKMDMWGIVQKLYARK